MTLLAKRLREVVDRLPVEMTRAQFAALVPAALARVLGLEPGDVLVSWGPKTAVLEIPTRIHYIDEMDTIDEFLKEVVARVEIADVTQLDDDTFRQLLRSIADGT